MNLVFFAVQQVRWDGATVFTCIRHLELCYGWVIRPRLMSAVACVWVHGRQGLTYAITAHWIFLDAAGADEFHFF